MEHGECGVHSRSSTRLCSTSSADASALACTSFFPDSASASYTSTKDTTAAATTSVVAAAHAKALGSAEARASSTACDEACFVSPNGDNAALGRHKAVWRAKQAQGWGVVKAGGMAGCRLNQHPHILLESLLLRDHTHRRWDGRPGGCRVM
jgi:hypothetical protein